MTNKKKTIVFSLRKMKSLLGTMLIVSLLGGDSLFMDSYCLAWSAPKIPNILRQTRRKKKELGGQHLVKAGLALQRASECVNNVNYYACPTLLNEAGISLKDAGEAWSDNNWEAVTYASEECAECLYELSQLQNRPILQKVYKGAAGELRAVASFQNPSLSAPSLTSLSKYLQEAANLSKKLRDECKDSSKFSKSLREASQSIGKLAKEQN